MTASFTGSGPAGAQTPEGVGTSSASQTLLSLQLGDGSLLDLNVLADTANSTIDSAVAPSHAVTRLVPLGVTSSALPALSGVTAALPTFESRTPGGNPSVKGSAINMANPGGVGGLPVGLLGGSLVPTSLTTALDGSGARSALDAALAKLSLVSGLVTVDSVSNSSTTAAAMPQANGARGLNIDSVSVLNLADLLAGLDLDLASLPLATISSLLKTLGVPVALPTGAADLAAAVSTLTAAIDDINDVVAGSSATLDDTVSTVPDVNSVVAGLPVSLPVSGTSLVNTSTLALPTGTVENALTTLQSTLTNLLGNALDAVGGVKLLELEGASIGATTKAADTLQNSAADVTAKLGGLSVLGLNLPGLDLLSVADTLNAVTGQLTSVLGVIDPSLKNLVKVAVLDKSTSVTTANGYNEASAGIDVLSVKITPPALLSNLVGTLTGGSTSSIGILGAAGVANPAASLPVLGGNAAVLGGLLDLPATVGALTKGLTLKVGSVKSSAQFKAASAPGTAVAPPGDTLPRTGGDSRTLGMLAAGMAALALGVRSWARRPEVS